MSYDNLSSVSQNVLKFFQQHTGEERRVPFVFGAYRLLAHDRWFSPGTPASSTTKIGRHDIDEILLKVALSTINQSINITQQLKHLITMYKLFCRMYSHYLHKTLGQSYYPTAEDFDYHVRQSIEMFNNCSRRKGLRACLEGAIQKAQPRDIGNIGYTRLRTKTKQMKKTKQSKPNHNTDIKTNDDCRNHTIKVNLLDNCIFVIMRSFHFD
jgi:hypothetical protein